MATTITTRETSGGGATVKNAPLTNAEIDNNFISLTTNKLESDNNLSDIASTSSARSNLGLEIGVDVQAFDANIAKFDTATANFTGTLQQNGSGVITVADIDVSVQSYDPNTAKYDNTMSNFTGTLQQNGTNVLLDSDIGSTVQAFDADTAKYDASVANFTGNLQQGGSSVLTANAVNPTFTDDGALGLPKGTQAQRPGSPIQGQIRFNIDSDEFEGYNGTEWDAIGGPGLFVEQSSGVWQTPAITSATVDGDFIATGDVTSLSDIQYKENIRSIESSLSIVDGLSGVYYNLKYDPDKVHVGLIAQEVEKVLPEVVSDQDEYKTVAYGNVVAVLIEAIKELKAEVEELKRGL